MLSNVKVLDLSRVLAGPLCSMILGDLGADVIKIERPGSLDGARDGSGHSVAGDETRGWGPPFDGRGESAYYLSANRNKLGVAVDLASSEGLALVTRLLVEADVVIDNFRAGALDRLGIDVAVLLERHPRLIWCTITGFGAGSDRPGYDFVVQAESGWMAITGVPEGDPMKVGVALADVIAGKDAAIAILAALVGRDVPRPASARHLVISLAHSATAALVNVAQNTLVSGDEARRWGNAHANLVPYELFHAADRALVIAVGSDAQWRSCARALDLLDLANDAGAATNSGRLSHRQFLAAEIGARVATRPAAHWIERLRAAGVPCGIVRSVKEALADVPGGASPLTGVSPAVPGTVRLPPPRLDEHGELVRELGWGAFSRVGVRARDTVGSDS
ncbi:MAG TPA: CoA transferase [Gemmatimonadaceae bacterium]|nr:CoA transferase [Gemmatimonadaceae bacterium]